MRWLCLLIVLLLGCERQNSSLTLAVSANFYPACKEIVENFEKSHQMKVDIVFSSSGNLYAQIHSGAPYDVFFSADNQYPQKLYQEKLSLSPKNYVQGRIVVWWKNSVKRLAAIEELQNEAIQKIAIAEPRYAPYGKAAKQALQNHHLWEKIQHKIVYAKNIMQAAQYIETGNADVGIVALSLAKEKNLHESKDFLLIDTKHHDPIFQDYCVINNSANVTAWLEFFHSSTTSEILEKYGYIVPKLKGGNSD